MQAVHEAAVTGFFIKRGGLGQVFGRLGQPFRYTANCLVAATTGFEFIALVVKMRQQETSVQVCAPTGRLRAGQLADLLGYELQYGMESDSRCDYGLFIPRY